MSESSPLSSKQVVELADLKGKIEIAFRDEGFAAFVQNEEPCGECRRICVFERGAQLDLLRSVPNTYAWSSPMPRQVLEDCGLVQLKCNGEDRVFRGVLIYPEGYRFSELDRLFLAKLREVAKGLA